MEGIKVIDNCIPLKIQNYIENLVLSSNTKYSFNNLTNYFIANNSKYQDGSQLINKFIEDGKFIVEDVSHYFLIPLQILCLQEGIFFNLQDVVRAKVNLKFKQEAKENTFINPPHIDTNLSNSLIGIYYINDSDGDTIIYEGNNINNLKPIQKINPKKGRMILMDGSTWHSASHPLKTETRMVINYNIIL
jgi:hypothetical protein|tara:strand:- start:1932 stop:2501 length:570 start_codon:yes stop_codon:yes gene_type:complete